LAINPLLVKSEETIPDNTDAGLDRMRDIGILSTTEFEEIVMLYHSKSARKEDYA
jgi:hypothetical protein